MEINKKITQLQNLKKGNKKAIKTLNNKIKLLKTEEKKQTRNIKQYNKLQNKYTKQIINKINLKEVK